MPEKRKRQHRDDVAFLADRLAISLMLLRREIDLGIALLPSLEGLRDSLRDDPDYDKFKNTVREILRAS